MNHVYLDNAATTPMHPAVVQAMTDQMMNDFGNASSTHFFGRTAHAALDKARGQLASTLHTKPDHIVFTGGATESNNTAIMQTARANAGRGKHIITTAIEHLSVLKPMRTLEAEGFTVTYLPVDENGEISLADFKAALDDETILVSIMYGNNEVGSVMPIAEIGALLADHQALFHVDATQAFGLIDLDPAKLGIDLLSASAHKLNGPKGVGLLYRSDNVHIKPLLQGGEQESKRRAGTENIPGIVGFGTAVALLNQDAKAQKQADFLQFSHQITAALTAADVEFHVNGNLEHQRLQHVLNLWLPGASTYALQTNLDLAGFAISGGSACTAGSLEPSHVLTAMYGEDSPRISESIRISFGTTTTAEDVDAFAQALIKIVRRLLARKQK
ncbi:cysteine desulfurase family protein [Lacticaseibacillus sharpeae]|uniref:cysteine desulfurase n=1 Tax=Lacticaseibacillus sharpeae JCM 1186 = DSM 20505 TaxID=1291052 RepID=A0A0R1ZNN6_9LACO|nr:cysteine desulfurase family protein [Lacticaseibacillus sharpeae]KRM54756.1 cysteine sulfinate desulfinase cysteine desulfurase [Lacticaseibacillus sharpeae JCM 1186 = DSM 20505]